MEDFGFIFVKFGQVLVICVDLFLFDWIVEFFELQNVVLVLLYVQVCDQFECDLGVLVSEVFVWFDEILMVVVLLVQVYCVILYDGLAVVFKIC